MKGWGLIPSYKTRDSKDNVDVFAMYKASFGYVWA